jgi:hypothetical protein
MPIIQLNLCATAQSVANWVDVTGGDSTGTKVSAGNVFDSTGTTVPGVSVSVTQAWTVTLDTAGLDHDSYPAGVEQSTWRRDSGATANLIISGLGAGSASVLLYGNRDTGDTDRVASATVTGQAGSTFNGTYDPQTGGSQSTRTLSGSVNLGSSDSITIAVTTNAGSVNTFLNAVIIDFTASAGGGAANLLSGKLEKLLAGKL